MFGSGSAANTYGVRLPLVPETYGVPTSLPEPAPVYQNSIATSSSRASNNVRNNATELVSPPYHRIETFPVSSIRNCWQSRTATPMQSGAIIQPVMPENFTMIPSPECAMVADSGMCIGQGRPVPYYSTRAPCISVMEIPQRLNPKCVTAHTLTGSENSTATIDLLEKEPQSRCDQIVKPEHLDSILQDNITLKRKLWEKDYKLFEVRSELKIARDQLRHDSLIFKASRRKLDLKVNYWKQECDKLSITMAFLQRELTKTRNGSRNAQETEKGMLGDRTESPDLTGPPKLERQVDLQPSPPSSSYGSVKSLVTDRQSRIKCEPSLERDDLVCCSQTKRPNLEKYSMPTLYCRGARKSINDKHHECSQQDVRCAPNSVNVEDSFLEPVDIKKIQIGWV